MMKRALLGILFSLWTTLAAAGIACPLPFALTNGTIADATQVMANYNTLVTCLASAANAGANTDITSLLGMTTPLTPASGGSSWFLGSTSTGSANAQAVGSLTPNSFVLANKSFVVFPAGFTNNGPTTVNVSGTGPIAVLQHAQSGLVPLAGGEIVATQATVLYYDGTQYQLFDASPQGLVLPCTAIDWQGALIPSGYLIEDGSAKSRSTFANLFGCLSISTSATTSSGNPTISTGTQFDDTQTGWFVGGNNVVCNTRILSTGTNTITLSNNATGNGATTLTVGPYAQGDCSTTFNLPDLSGRATVATDRTGGHLSSTACPNPSSSGSLCGSLTQTIPTASLPAGTIGSASVVSASTAIISASIAGSNVTFGNGGSTNQGVLLTANTGISAQVTSTGSVTSSGTATPFLLQPVGLVLKVIKF